jgi:cytoskeleton protein RodZ
MTDIESEAPFEPSLPAAEVLMAHLREARENKGWSQEEISDRTRISLYVLQALEANDFNIVEPPFVRAFLRMYAQKVGVPVEEVNDVFPEPATHVEEPKDEDRSIPIIPRSRIPWQNVLRTGGVLLFLIVLWIWHPWRTRESQLTSELPVRGDVTESLIAIPDDSSGTAAAASDSSSATDSTRSDSVSVPEPTPEHEPELRRVKTPTVVPPFPQMRKEVTLGIVARDTVWIQLSRLNGEVIYDAIMLPGNSHEWKVRRVVRVNLGRYWGVDVLLDGKKVDVPHGRGDVTKFRLSPKGISTE